MLGVNLSLPRWIARGPNGGSNPQGMVGRNGRDSQRLTQNRRFLRLFIQVNSRRPRGVRAAADCELL